MDIEMPRQFAVELLKLGVLPVNQQHSMWDVAKQCASKFGSITGSSFAIMGRHAAPVAIAGTSITIPGALAVFLAGLAVGTLSCTVINTRLRIAYLRLIDQLEGNI
jgi:hypothetical protein